jgi:hypothetical protein
LHGSESLLSLANRIIPFPVAARWAGVDAGGRAKAYCPFGFEHDDGGREQALRVYSDHGYCFSEQRYFSVTSLLAAAWDVSHEDAAAEALRRYGWKPVSLAHLWEGVTAAQEPDRNSLRAALVVWCASQCPDWALRQYEAGPAGKLAQCLGLLFLVTSEADCETWLAAAKRAMGQYLT